MMLIPMFVSGTVLVLTAIELRKRTPAMSRISVLSLGAAGLWSMAAALVHQPAFGKSAVFAVIAAGAICIADRVFWSRRST